MYSSKDKKFELEISSPTSGFYVFLLRIIHILYFANQMKSKTLILFSISLFIFGGCTKDEGYGGTASISGSLTEQIYNEDFSELIFEQKAIDEDIFIVFESNGIVSDKVTTGFDGQFEFEQLFPGNYQIYYYSENQNSAYGEDIEVIIEVELEKNTNYDLGELVKVKSIDYDDGSASIKGRVFLINYLNSSEYPNLIVKDTSLAQDQDIFITYGNHAFHDDKIETTYDGTFLFQDLIKGNYKVFLYSEDITGKTEDIVIMHEVSISSEFTEIDLGDIYIEKL